MTTSRPTRLLAAALVAVGIGLASPTPVHAQDRSDPSTTLPVVDEGGGRPAIVPDPFSGEAPDDSGDRGGTAQLALLGALLAGLGLTAGRVVQVARRADRDRRAGTAPD